MAETPPLWLMILTVASYLAFFVGFGETVIDTVADEDCSGLASCTSAAFSLIGAFFQLITLGGFTSPLPALIQVPLLILFGFTWGKIILDTLISTVGAVIP